MRVVLATDHFPPHPSGHAVAVAWWADALARAGAELLVVTDAPPRPDVGYAMLRWPTLPGLPIGHPVAALRPPGRAPDRLRRFAPDVVHLHGYGPLCQAVLRQFPRTPCAFTLHQFPEGSGAPGIPGLHAAMARLLTRVLRRSALTVVPSQIAHAKLRARWGVEGLVLPTGVAAPFLAARRAPRAPAGDGRPRVLFVGRRSPDKNFGQVVRLARAHPEAQWTAVGHGPLAVPEQIRAIAPTTADGVARLLREADVLLAPSRNETQGLAALEAVTVGTAVAMPWGTAQSEMVDEGRSGVGYDPSDDADAWRAVRAAAALTHAGGVRASPRFEAARLTEAQLEAYGELGGGRAAVAAPPPGANA